MSATFFDLLGIARNLADRATPAAALWPNSVASLTPGFNLTNDALTVVNQLQAGTSYTNIRPGVDGRVQLGGGAAGQIAVAADMAVDGAPATAQPFYLRALPDLGIQLKLTDPLHPARIYSALDGRGFEIIIDRLPVTLLLKRGLATAIASAPVFVGSFDGTAVDSFAYTLQSDALPSRLECFVRLHLTVEGDVILEPAVPLSLGPVRWMGLPAKAVYDIQLLPSPSRRDYLEWTHNDPGSFLSNPPARGANGFRSIELDFTQPPFSDLKKRLSNGAVNVDKIELVLEDVIIPATSPMLPIPSHGTFGFRRRITDPGDIKQAFSLDGAPVSGVVYSSGSQGGTTLTLTVDKFFFRTGDVHAADPADQPQLQFQADLVYQSGTNTNTPGTKIGGTVGIDDQWTINAGIALDPATTPVKMTIADTTVGLVGLKFGVSISRLTKAMEFKDSFELLGDLFVQGKPSTPSKTFAITSLTGKPLSIVMRDIGYKLGNPSLSGLQMPDGMQLIFANTVYVIIEELGWVEEPNGTPYFSFSGGVAVGAAGGETAPPQGNSSDNSASGFGIRVRRLRFRLNADGTQPFLKLDGIFLKLKYSKVVDIEGFGYISDYTDTGWAIKEWGFGVKVGLDVIAMNFSIAAMFMKGSRTLIADPSQNFDYFLAALELGFLPAGPIGLYDIRALVASNLSPNLGSTFPDGEGMALLKWHQSHDHALSMPSNRNLSDWLPENHAFAFGVGCGFSINGCGSAVHLSIFIFFEKANANTGLLIVGDLFLLKNPKPIAFVAIEYDIDKEKFGVMVGVDLSIGDFAGGSVPSWLANIARLSGNLYFGNQPWSFAIGQLSDQSSWLSLIIDFDVWLVIKFQLGVCVQIVDGGPKGFGLVVMLSAGSDWGIGSFVLWGSFGLIIGTWKTGSDTSGVEFWIGLGFKINLFWIFSFGVDISLRLTYLGKHPWYITLHAEIRIDTPWFLPDVTFTIDKTWQEPLPFDTASVTQCLSKATGIDPTAQKGIPLLLPGLAGALGDASYLYTFNQIAGLKGALIADTHLRDDVPVVSVDATIAVDFFQPVSNDTLVATSTYAGGVDAGVQTVQDLTIRYGLSSISIRRAPRFGPNAGVWTSFIADADTAFSIGGVAPQTLTFAWDTDQRADGHMSPKRLLLNSSAPYSFATGGAKNDEEAARNDADFPCCDGRTERQKLPRPHILEFSAIVIGARAPRNERFSGKGGAWWHWAGVNTPAIVPGDPTWPGQHAARITPRGAALAGAADLPEPAAFATIDLAWDRLPGILYFEAYAGAQLAGLQTVELHNPGNTSLSIGIPAKNGPGLSRLTLRFEMDPKAVFGDASLSSFIPTTGFAVEIGFSPEAAIRVLRATYTTLADTLAYAGTVQRCKNGGTMGPPGSDASGKLAFLPNHDYEIVLSTEIQVGSKDQGPRKTVSSESVYFRTKGLPGLNAAANVGDDIRRHIAATYPMRRAIPLYRQEPCVLSFENSLSSVLPIDRAPGPGAPAEKAQMFPLELNVDRVASLDGRKRLTVPTGDWISEHRANPYPPIIWVAGMGYAKSKVRLGQSSDLLVQRFEAIKLAFPGCGPQKLDHASQVLLHEPISADLTTGSWEPQAGYRATVRQQGGPYTERTSFDIYDLGAFIPQSDGGAAASLWSVDAGALAAPAGGGRHYAACGEPDWDHLQVLTLIDLRSATAAGIAIGVGAGNPVPQAILATVEIDGGGHSLVLRARSAGVETELGRQPVQISGVTALHVTAFDDNIRAAIGETVVEAPRKAIREGRVALVAAGPAAFKSLIVNALDIFTFEFITSRYASFAAHITSYEGKLPVSPTGSFGGAPATITAVLAAQGGGIAEQMKPEADPQARQSLFAAIVAALGIGLAQNPRSVTLSRLTDASGTAGLILQSPEPISITRDVTLSMTRHIRQWVWDGPIIIFPQPPLPLPQPFPLPRPGPVISPAFMSSAAVRPMAAATVVNRPQIGATAAPALTIDGIARAGLAAQANAKVTADIEAATPGLVFAQDAVALPRGSAAIPADSQIVHVIDTPAGRQIEIFAAPSGLPGKKTEVLTVQQAASRPELAAAAKLPPGSIGVIHGGGVRFGHWEEKDIDAPLLLLSNGDETAMLILAPGGAPWSAGNYKLKAVLDRDRWSNTGAADPEQHYHDEAVLMLSW